MSEPNRVPEPNQLPSTVSLDLIPSQMYGKAVRKIVLTVGVLTAIAMGLVFWAVNWWVALIVGVLVSGPTILSALSALRRSVTLSGTTVHAVRGVFTKKVDLANASTVELVVRPGRINMINLYVSDGKSAVTLPLALYSDGAGRELEILAIRGLADGLAASHLAAALAASTVLVNQLRAMARDASPNERPLYRATMQAAASKTISVTLTDEQVAALVNMG
ncbi:hypothetical protein [Smaragdicoccus niigatensis]|uniref:hypothetical protein n=1 Tax=Smaragdicoccus niigatensis TaxID=359359 RepID=UPI0012DE5578|nr:hypothetical protein [Smaragdicoccus niigatensis]